MTISSTVKKTEKKHASVHVHICVGLCTYIYTLKNFCFLELSLLSADTCCCTFSVFFFHVSLQRNAFIQSNKNRNIQPTKEENKRSQSFLQHLTRRPLEMFIIISLTSQTLNSRVCPETQCCW